MRFSKDWNDYELISAGDGQKIERYGTVVLKRPEPLATWPLDHVPHHIDATFDKAWTHHKDLPDSWQINYKDMVLKVQPTSFKHTGVFPEQAVNWDWMRGVIKTAQQPLRILNLFGYTGGATIACGLEDEVVEVVHIDALKSLNNWTQENVALNQLSEKMIRTITEDVMKFCQREKRRGRTYHGIIMDPPSFGRGPKGEKWTIKEQLDPLLNAALDLLDREALFLVLNTYTTDLSGATVEQKLQSHLKQHNFPAITHTDDIGLPITAMNRILPCGVTTRWCYREDLL